MKNEKADMSLIRLGEATYGLWGISQHLHATAKISVPRNSPEIVSADAYDFGLIFGFWDEAQLQLWRSSGSQGVRAPLPHTADGAKRDCSGLLMSGDNKGRQKPGLRSAARRRHHRRFRPAAEQNPEW